MSVIDELSGLLNLPSNLSAYEKRKAISEKLTDIGFSKDMLKSKFSSKQLYAALKNSTLPTITGGTNQNRLSDYIINIHQKKEPSQKPTYSSKPLTFSPKLTSILQQKKINRLYKHQQEAIDVLNFGKNVVLTTETASGKSLVYLLPFLEEVLRDSESTGLFIFPTKALSNDQMRTLDSFGIATLAKYDGSLDSKEKESVRNKIPHAIFTNPDTIHQSMLRTHDKWKTFLKNLKFIVIDEIHLYKGYFGSNVSNIIHRLLSAVEKAGGNPKIVCTSATINDAGQFAKDLAHREFHEISSNCSGRAAKEYNFIESEKDPKDGSPLVSPMSILLYLTTTQINQKKQGIVFIDSRDKIDLVTKYAKEISHKYNVKPEQIARYHAGMDDEERVRVEQGLKNKDILTVFSTSALEIGVDIGSLDYCILYGIPPHNNQIWQRIGRVGRNPNSSVAVSIINRYSFRDQYYFNNYDHFFKTKLLQSKPKIFPKNDYLQELHQQCAFFEGMKKSETLNPSLWKKVKKSNSNKGGAYLRIPIRKPWYDDYTLIDETTQKKIGTVEYERVFRDYHRNAVVLVKDKYYKCKNFIDYKNHKITLSPITNPEYYTKPKIESYIQHDDTKPKEKIVDYGEHQVIVGEGKLTVELTITGMTKYYFDNAGIRSSDLNPPPEKKINTHALWIAIKDNKIENQPYVILHTLEHLLQRAIIELNYCDWADIAGITVSESPLYTTPTLFIYENMKSGTGMSSKFYKDILKIIEKAKEIVKSCPCQVGCPQCISIPNYCDLRDQSLDKGAVIEFLGKLDISTATSNEFHSNPSFSSDDFESYERDKFIIGDEYAVGWKVIGKTEERYAIQNLSVSGRIIWIKYEDEC